MENIIIRARNNLDTPIRLTLTSTACGETQILITIGNEGVKLSGYYGVCIDKDIVPNKDWNEIGTLDIETKSKISIKGQAI